MDFTLYKIKLLLLLCVHARYESCRHVADGIVADGTKRSAVKKHIMKTEEDSLNC